MAFGRLTTKWRRLRTDLNFHTGKNLQIICLCTKLHNYCIRITHHRIKQFEGDTVNPSDYGIEPLGTNSSRCNTIVADVALGAIQRPAHNMAMNS
eukprot:15311884-Ditylum_brightwellii.AAC.1